MNEKDLASKASITTEELRKQLYKLQQQQIITYQPSSDQPRLTFLQPRLPENELVFPKSLLEERKKRIVESAEKLKHYVTDHFHCRSVMLLAYFNETAEQRCGTCDYCRMRNKLELNDVEFKTAETVIISSLKEKATSPHDLIYIASPLPEEKVLKVIQFMLDNGDIKINEDGNLELTS